MTAADFRQACRSLVLVVAGLAVAMPAGCSGRTRGYPPLAGVTGRVTLGGSALPNVQVSFRHRDGGRAAVAITDADGRFALRFTEVAAGAAVGPNRVSFAPLPGAESFPKELTQTRDVEVANGRNHFDFELLGDVRGDIQKSDSPGRK